MDNGTKPFYQSKTVWAGFAAVVLGVIGILGVSTEGLNPDEIAELLATVGTVVAGIAAIYGRVVANQRLSR